MLEPEFITEKSEEDKQYGKFILNPLPSGFGHTLGNALRRTLLSTIPGVAVCYVKINDAVHPFSTISGVKESVLDLILNLKLLRFKVVGDGPYEVSLSTKGIGKITGSDFKGSDVSVVNKDQYIAEITSAKTKLDITLFLEKGLGFSSSEEKENKEYGKIAVDSVYSPVLRVNYQVEGSRVGRKTNFDRLTMEIWTDESITPSESLKKCAQQLSGFFSHILSGRDIKRADSDEKMNKDQLTPKLDKKVYQTIIDELDLPTRVINALLREGIETVEDLLKRGKEDLVNLKGVGKKSLDLIEKELEKLSIPFEDTHV
ncbi:DNA-directed RNA polymerase subunit alpha [Candidatus Roizmanbacteria bacterium RIFCSPHIGHO2_02_FULL_37_13b]|uniref:DNA-directed RNA polymerase subunit alpha n=1 Tax=Candidatus Roizmanbacteria bacterium RIFCSPLOWO2_02_FULL_36_11 TaxID=1802071 RepID=A0A1F7JCH7_9BACT|nr:MAG: DNA-directed RNA polymerase subunit alpha [Candidatus Roizmanbacteria bacterium RIFCSPHIGHO2_02_FULL_37_13b]OGK53309.1 MAG: DNA-directed RNA polymerase subunit alpha [Candidatus Roizmanbacteria bacterium RIFCSPLOWO2_02_FULL_36_11]